MQQEYDIINEVNNPLDSAEEVFNAYEWSFDRIKENELKVSVKGKYDDYDISLVWNEGIGALLFYAQYQFTLPEHAMRHLPETLFKINKDLWIGMFSIDDNETRPTFQHTCLFRGFLTSETSYIEEFINIAVFECDRFHPVFKSLSDAANENIDVSNKSFDFMLMDVEGHS